MPGVRSRGLPAFGPATARTGRVPALAPRFAVLPIRHGRRFGWGVSIPVPSIPRCLLGLRTCGSLARFPAGIAPSVARVDGRSTRPHGSGLVVIATRGGLADARDAAQAS